MINEGDSEHRVLPPMELHNQILKRLHKCVYHTSSVDKLELLSFILYEVDKNNGKRLDHVIDKAIKKYSEERGGLESDENRPIQTYGLDY